MKLLGAGLLLVFSFTVNAALTTYEVGGVKTLTPYVDRMFNLQNRSFANLFCQENTVENASLLLVIDGSALDGQIFYFPSVASCQEAQALVKDNYKNCQVLINLNSENRTAQVVVRNCL